MTTTVTWHNQFMFDDALAERVEDTLDNWASEGVDYHWIDPLSLQVEVPDDVSYADVFEDIAGEINEHMRAKTMVPFRLLAKFVPKHDLGGFLASNLALDPTTH